MSHDDAFTQGLQQLMEQHFPPDAPGRTFTIADGALIPDLPQTLFGDLDIEACSLAPDTAREDMELYPYLFSVSGPDSSEWQWVCQSEYCETMVHFRARYDMQDAFSHARLLTQAHMPEGAPVWLRFYDPEVLFPLLTTSTAEQAGHFWGQGEDTPWRIEHWLGLHEDGTLLQAIPPGDTYRAPAPLRLHLTPVQLEALQEAYSNRMCRLSLAHLRARIPESCATLTLTQQAILKNAVDDAFTWGIDEAATIPWYVECVFRWGLDFPSLPRAAAILTNSEYSGHIRAHFLFDMLQEETKS